MNANPWATLSDASLRAALAALELEQQRNHIDSFFRDGGEFPRSGYIKHLEFFRAGAEHQERAFMAANRVGKTVVGGYECALHCVGDYPDWWEGRRFDHPVDGWVASNTGETTRDIVQLELLGRSGDYGTGMLRYSAIEDISPRRGIPDAVDSVRVRHKSGGTSTIGFKSYDQGREKFQGTKKHFVWFDEEPEASVYDEAMVRLMTTDGLMLCTFTPLKGLSEVALRFLPDMAPVLETGNVRAA